MGGQRDEVFTSGEVAKICGVSADTVSRWFDLGQLGGYRLGPGGDRRIPYESLRQFMLSHGIPIDRLEAEQRRILVVDDDPYYLDVLPSALSKSGRLLVYTASTGFDAGAMVAEQNPHLIILDIHLSDMDGRMVSQRVRARPETRNTRIIAITPRCVLPRGVMFVSLMPWCGKPPCIQSDWYWASKSHPNCAMPVARTS